MTSKINQMTICLYVTVLFCLLTLATPAYAKVAVAKILTTKGKVVAIDADAKERTLKRRSKVFEGDTLVTDENGIAQLRFRDGAIYSLKENTQFEIESYKYDPNNKANNESLLKVPQGGFRAVTGKIADINRKNYKVTTKFATMGVRGTMPEVFVDVKAKKLAGDERIDIFTTYGGELFVSLQKKDKLAQTDTTPQFIDAQASQGVVVNTDTAGIANQKQGLTTVPAHQVRTELPNIQQSIKANKVDKRKVQSEKQEKKSQKKEPQDKNAQQKKNQDKSSKQKQAGQGEKEKSKEKARESQKEHEKEHDSNQDGSEPVDDGDAETKPDADSDTDSKPEQEADSGAPPPPEKDGESGTLPPPPEDEGELGMLPPPPEEEGELGLLPPPPEDEGELGLLPPPPEGEGEVGLLPPPPDGEYTGTTDRYEMDADLQFSDSSYDSFGTTDGQALLEPIDSNGTYYEPIYDTTDDLTNNTGLATSDFNEAIIGHFWTNAEEAVLVELKKIDQEIDDATTQLQFDDRIHKLTNAHKFGYLKSTQLAYPLFGGGFLGKKGDDNNVDMFSPVVYDGTETDIARTAFIAPFLDTDDSNVTTYTIGTSNPDGEFDAAYGYWQGDVIDVQNIETTSPTLHVLSGGTNFWFVAKPLSLADSSPIADKTFGLDFSTYGNFLNLSNITGGFFSFKLDQNWVLKSGGFNFYESGGGIWNSTFRTVHEGANDSIVFQFDQDNNLATYVNGAHASDVHGNIIGVFTKDNVNSKVKFIGGVNLKTNFNDSAHKLQGIIEADEYP